MEALGALVLCWILGQPVTCPFLVGSWRVGGAHLDGWVVGSGYWQLSALIALHIAARRRTGKTTSERGKPTGMARRDIGPFPGLGAWHAVTIVGLSTFFFFKITDGGVSMKAQNWLTASEALRGDRFTYSDNSEHVPSIVGECFVTHFATCVTSRRGGGGAL